jgi:hypothetical protein
MGYDRTYSREEIHQMLYLSERRLRPSSPAAKAHAGHAISRHTEQRADPFDRRQIRQDSTFASRKDLVLAVEEVLHDPQGQQQLATLNARNVVSCPITVQLTASLGKIKANVVRSPMAKVGNKSLPAEGPQHYLQNALVNSVFVLVDKVASAESWTPLHIQTAYPKDIVS